MFRNIMIRTAIVLVCVVLIFGCDFLDPARPSAQPDAVVFGNILDISEDPATPGVWIATVRVGVPRALERADELVGIDPPEVEKGLDAIISLNSNSVVLNDGKSSDSSAFQLGTEVVAIPVPGTTFMIGTSRIEVDGAYFLDFETYRNWKLPKLESRAPEELREDASLINSSAAEMSPVPLNGGSVLYFVSKLRPPYLEDSSWIGARRDGLPEPGDGQASLTRSYRTEIGNDGWSTPELISFPGLDDSLSIRVSWVNEAEDRALVSVISSDGTSWLGESSRASLRKPWGEITKFDAIADNASDAVYLEGSSVKLTFVTTRDGGQQADLFYYDSSTEDLPLPLEPKLNTVSNEWRPRIGPNNALFFVRDNQQMVLSGGELRALRLPGAHRSEFSQAAPTSDGAWLFFCLPGYTPLEYDQDIFVAPLNDDFSIGDPIPVDQWRPAQ